ncbi:MAG: cobalt-zinc-cadmium efflux system membrane fusion protein [Cyclobacteriaceae bacterium]|jgi:cobalt-zinc-cadmium efflux system membrane fusion protein
MQNKIQYISNMFLIGSMTMFMASCYSKTEDAAKEKHHAKENSVELTQEQYDQASIELGSIEKRIIGSELMVNGIIDVPPKGNISINMPYGGFVKYIDMLPGTLVKKGQLLAIIENPEFIQFQQDYLEGLANQEFLKAEFDRQQELYNEKVASGKIFQQAKSNYMSNEARIKTMEARLNLIGIDPAKIRDGIVSAAVKIYSPVTGYVREVYTNMGKYINPQDVIMDITNSEDLHVELTVYENDIPKVKKGQRIRFSLANSPKQWREAKVFLLGSSVKEDRSITVHGHLDQMYEDLLPGMYVAAKVETGSNEVWAVPEPAVVRFGGKQYIFTYGGERTENGQVMRDFEMKEVKKGASEDEYTQISLVDISTDIGNIKLVTKGAFTLLAKAKNTEEDEGH